MSKTKNKKVDPVMASMPVMPKPTSTVVVTKEQAKTVSVGDSIALTINGAVKGIQERYDDSGKYDLQIESPKVSSISQGENQADRQLKRMVKEY